MLVLNKYMLIYLLLNSWQNGMEITKSNVATKLIVRLCLKISIRISQKSRSLLLSNILMIIYDNKFVCAAVKINKFKEQTIFRPLLSQNRLYK